MTDQSRRFALTICVLLVVITIFARALPGPRSIDDSFITFRYSRNIVEGQGFVYNPGVKTLGTTTPLFTLLMAGMGAITGGQDFPWYAITASMVADSLTVVLLYSLARRLIGSDWLAALPSLMWAISPMSVTFAVGGMETSVNIVWMVGATWLYTTSGIESKGSGAAWKPALMGVCAALGLLTRIDALLWIGPLLALQLVETGWSRRGQPILRRFPWRTWLAFAVTLTPWLVFSLVYFGSPLPNSLSAKTAAYVMPPGAALITLIQTYATPFFEYEAFGAAAVLIGSIVYLTLSLISIVYARRAQPRLLPFLFYPWLYLIVFAAANPLIFRWYLAPPLPALMLGIVAGIWAIMARAPARWLIPAVAGGLALVWGATSLNAWTLHPDHGPDRPAPQMAWHQIELHYQQIATELREQYGVTSDTRVASADIGAVGYFSRATIIDTVGLVTPAMRAYYPVSPALIPPGQNYAIPPRLILDTQPDFLVTMEAFVRLGLEQDAQFRRAYKLVDSIPTDFYGTGMYLYKRQ